MRDVHVISMGLNIHREFELSYLHQAGPTSAKKKDKSWFSPSWNHKMKESEFMASLKPAENKTPEITPICNCKDGLLKPYLFTTDDTPKPKLATPGSIVNAVSNQHQTQNQNQSSTLNFPSYIPSLGGTRYFTFTHTGLGNVQREKALGFHLPNGTANPSDENPLFLPKPEYARKIPVEFVFYIR